MIDYQKMNKILPKQKSALTRAAKSQDTERIVRVCREAVLEWNAIGAWPDCWSNWQRALNDSLPWHQHVYLEEL